MKRIPLLICITLLAAGIAGIFIGGYGGGVLTGSCIVMVLLATVGYRLAAAAETKFEKKIRDVVVENMKI